MRTFREKSVLATQLAARQREEGNEASAARFEEDAQQAEQYGGLIQQYLLQGAPHPPVAPAGGRSGEPSRTEDSAARLAAPTPVGPASRAGPEEGAARLAAPTPEGGRGTPP